MMNMWWLLFMIVVVVVILIVCPRMKVERYVPTSLPSTIIIIRHGEKIKNSLNLSPAGYVRSYGLVDYFEYPRSPLIPVPDVVYAAKCIGWNGTVTGCESSARPIETVTPFVDATNTPFIIDYEVGDEKGLAANVLTQNDKCVLICWEHDHIHDIVNDLFTTSAGKVTGWGLNPFGPIDGKVFDLCWVFTLQPDGTYSFTILPQFTVDPDPPYTLTYPNTVPLLNPPITMHVN